MVQYFLYLNETESNKMENFTYNSMHPNLLKSMIFKRLVFIFFLVITVFIGYFLESQDWFTPVVLTSMLVFLIFLMIGLILLAKAYFRRKRVRIMDKNIAYQEGLIFQKETTVPFARIQHIEIDEGPLERYFKLATLSIYTAGDSGRDLKISGLELEKAQEIKAFISNFMKDEQ